MAAMVSCFDVVHLEDNICVSCQDLKKQGSLRYYMLTSMVEILCALNNVWATLFPFALLWWNLMLYATCAKYYSWNRSRLRLQIAGQCFHCDIMLESCSSSEVAIGEERENSLFSPQQSGSSAADQNREMSGFSLYREVTCAEKNDVGSISHEKIKLHHWNRGFGDSVDPFPHWSGLCMLQRYSDVAAACVGESGPHHLNQFEGVVSFETTSLGSKAQAIGASLRTSKLSSLCFLEGRQLQPSGLLKGCHWAACSVLSPHQVRPLAVLDVHCCPQIPLEYSCLQANLHGKGFMLGLKVPMLIDHVSIDWSMLRDWLQTFYEVCVPVLNCGKQYQDLAWNFTTSQIRNDNYALLQFILWTSEGFRTFYSIFSYDAIKSIKLKIGEQLSLRDLSGFEMKSNIAYVDNEDNGSASSEDLGSMSCSSIVSDGGCNGVYCTDAESTLEKDDGFRGYEYIGIASVEDAEDIHGSFVYPTMCKCGGFYTYSGHCEVGYDGLHCVTDVDGIPTMVYDAGNFDNNVEDSCAVCGDFHVAHEHGVYENPSEVGQIHVSMSNTWFDEGVVLVDKQEIEEDSIKLEWQVVEV